MSRSDRPFFLRLSQMKQLTIDIPLVIHTTVAAVVLLAFWFWP